jgi:prepilin-type N-terminal cleavage/methylation domain-containing protein
MRRRGFSLLELLVVIPVFSIIAGLCYLIMRPCILEPPRMERAGQTHMQITFFLSTLQEDINAAVSLPQQYEQTSAGPETLLIDTGEAVLCYRVEKDRLTRTALKGSVAPEEKRWDLPDAKIAFTPWPTDTTEGSPRAIRVRTAVEYLYNGESMEKLVNSRILFLAAMPGAKEDRP